MTVIATMETLLHLLRAVGRGEKVVRQELVKIRSRRTLGKDKRGGAGHCRHLAPVGLEQRRLLAVV
jgi:hypothetical protein